MSEKLVLNGKCFEFDPGGEGGGVLKRTLSIMRIEMMMMIMMMDT